MSIVRSEPKTLTIRKDERAEDRLQQVLKSPNLFATTLMVVAIDRLAMEDPRAKSDPAVAMQGMNELLSWSPQTLRLELVRTTGVLVPWSAIDRLLAAINIFPLLGQVAAALLIADGTWDVGQMANVEDLDPRPFMNLLNVMGLPNRVKDADGDRALAF